MQSAGANINGKIWYFVKNDVEVEVVDNTEQQIYLKLLTRDQNTHILATFVNARCERAERILLWDSLSQHASYMDLPWLVGGDFNVILNEEEKIGGLPVTWQECEDFAECINSNALFDVGYKGSPFIWWNGRIDAECFSRG